MFSWAHLGLVVVGGMLGTAVRAGLTVVVGDGLGPWLVPAVNVAGAFAMGALVGALARAATTPGRREVQLFAGTGVLGGFTTYSALAVESADPGLLWLGAASVAIGTAAAWAGVVVGRRRRGSAT